MHILAILATVEALAILALGLAAHELMNRLEAERRRTASWREDCQTWALRWARREGGGHRVA
jgi:hypothetical protein